MRKPPLLFLLAVFLLASCDSKPAEPAALFFSVRDFGAVPDDGKPDGEAIRKCIQAAISSGQKAEVVLDAGSYHIDPAPGATAMGEWVSLPIHNARDLSLRGSPEGTTLVFTNPSAGGIALDGCQNILLKNLQIDYDPVPYMFGTVKAVDLEAYTFDLELDAGSIDPTHPAFTKARALWGIVVRPDAEHGTTHYGPAVFRTKSKVPLGGNLWRLTAMVCDAYGDVLLSPGMKPGARFVYMPRNWGSAVGIFNCENVRLEGISVFSSPGHAFFPYLSRAVSLVDCHVKVRAGRPLSTNADGIHARGQRGDLLIERCSFEGMADDAINIHSSAIVVKEVLSPTEIAAIPHTWSARPGDQLVAYDSKTMTEKGRTAVASVEQNAGQTLIRFTSPLEGLRAGQGFADADRLYNLSEAGGPFVVRDCRFLAHRGRGILVSAINGVIENNVFENNEGWAVVLDFGDAVWAEGPPAQNLKITGNVFLGRGGINPSIVTRSTGPEESRIAGRRFFKELVIKDNEFLNLRAPAIRLYGIDGALVENNLLATDRPPSGQFPFAGLEVENASGVIVRHWKVEDPRFGTAARIGSGVDAGEAGIRIQPPGQPLVIDDRRLAR